MQFLTEAGGHIAASREPIRNQITHTLARMIVTGAVAPEETLGVASMARLLGVSPTPVREALVELGQQGLVDVRPGRGFTVPRLDPEELRELYEAINALEAVALRLQPHLSVELLECLDELNARLRASEPGFDALELDANWHNVLLSECDNSVLRDQLRILRTRARRYEVRFMAETQRVERSADQHDDILAALREQRLDEALEHLEHNWLGSIASVLPQLDTDPARPPRGLLR